MRERFDRFPYFTRAPRLSNRLDRKPLSCVDQHIHFSQSSLPKFWNQALITNTGWLIDTIARSWHGTERESWKEKLGMLDLFLHLWHFHCLQGRNDAPYTSLIHYTLWLVFLSASLNEQGTDWAMRRSLLSRLIRKTPSFVRLLTGRRDRHILFPKCFVSFVFSLGSVDLQCRLHSSPSLCPWPIGRSHQRMFWRLWPSLGIKRRRTVGREWISFKRFSWAMDLIDWRCSSTSEWISSKGRTVSTEFFAYSPEDHGELSLKNDVDLMHQIFAVPRDPDAGCDGWKPGEETCQSLPHAWSDDRKKSERVGINLLQISMEDSSDMEMKAQGHGIWSLPMSPVG